MLLPKHRLATSKELGVRMTKYAIIPALFVLAGGALLLHAATDSGIPT
jgi:hypothetical protein